MQKPDRVEFGRVLSACLEIYAIKLSPEAMAVWWNVLHGYAIEQVRAALSAHVSNTDRGRFAPKPADVIAQIQARDGHPSSEEAWAICASALNDERITIVQTEQMRIAFAVALDLHDDPIAARMAFKEVYQHQLAVARERGQPPHWSASLGFDAAGREGPILEAVRKGRLSSEHALRLLPHREELAATLKQLVAPVETSLTA